MAERDTIADDCMIALALAHLSIDRPGWLWTLRGLCDERGWREDFEGFLEIIKVEDETDG
jgi:hypothetical protein